MELPTLLTFVASWFTTIGGVWTLFERAESVSSERAKAAITAWLKNLPTKDLRANWPDMFSNIFDRVFGERHLSLKCFLRSSVASLVTVAIFTLLNSTRALPWTVIASVAFISLFPNYLSLLETRFVLRWMSRKPSVARNLLGVAIDVIATIVIALALGLLSVEFWVAIIERTGLVYTGIAIAMVWSNLLVASVVFTSAWASVWLWLYAFSGFGLRALQRLRFPGDWLKSVLDIDNKPIRSLGVVSMILVTVCYLIAGLFVLLG